MMVTESYKPVWDRFARAQESQARTAQGIIEDATKNLITQAERNLSASEELGEQGCRGQEAGRILAQASAAAYTQFLDSLFLYYRESARLDERGTEEKYDNVRNYDGSWTEWGNAVRAPIER